jgi:hypothetical protein
MMNTKAKKFLTNTVKTVSFLLILFLILQLISFALQPKNNDKASGYENPNAHGYLSLANDTLDVAMIGNSDAYAGFSPMEIWNSYGITSYVCGTGHQSINESVDVLKQIMQNQKPKVVMYEVDALWTDFDPATVMLKETERRVSNQLTVFKYHDLWKHFNSKALSQKKNYTAHFVTKGQNVNACQVPYDGDEYMVKTDKSKKVSQLFKPYLDEFVKVCKDNNVELVFVEFPSPVSWSYEKYN